MNFKMKGILGSVLVLTLLLAGFTISYLNTMSAATHSDKLNIVATTTMLTDLVRVIGGERVTVNGLMGPGIDPHLYQASAGDVSRMQKADIVVYHGMHLEGKMIDIFENLSRLGKAVIGIENGFDKAKLLRDEEDHSMPDPHIWFDVSLWKDAAQIIANGLSKADPTGSITYETNLETYLNELDAVDQYIQDRTTELRKEQRVLVTAHDAFQYFGNAYGFEVRGLQGISTDAEAGTADLSNLANFIVNRQIKAIFVESSVPPRTIEALQAAVKARGFDVVIGGELYSDSLGDLETGTETYILTIKANIDTIVDALK